MKTFICIISSVAILSVVGTACGTPESETKDAKKVTTSTSPVTEAPETVPPITEAPETVPPAPPVTEAPAPPPPPAPPARTESVSQEQARKSAEQYLDLGMGFSRQGLIEQLEYEEFSNADATYAADTSGADWNDQARQSAENYIDTMPFSRGDLIDQLLYEGFSQGEAEYGVNSVGL